MFIYLPLWFSFGAILYLALRLVTARVGGSLNGPTLAVLSAIALVTLVLASLLQPVARVGLALAALAVGAVAASLLWGQPVKTDSKPSSRDVDTGRLAEIARTLVSPQGQPSLEREKLDIGRALIVGAAALFVAFAALQYDYNLLRSVTKFSAGEVVSIEFGQINKKGSSFAQGGSGQQSIAALPRTESINYITSQLANMRTYIDADNFISRSILGVDKAVLYADPQLDYFTGFMDNCVIPLAKGLEELQQKYNSEFPALSGIGRISILARRLYLIVDRGTRNDKSAIQGLQEGNKQFALPGISEAFINYLKEVSFDLELLNISSSLNSKTGDQACERNSDNHIVALDEFLRLVTFNQNNIVNIDNNKLNEFSDTLGYLSMLVAFSEFADGNRESAIQLIDNRIDDELITVKKLEISKTSGSVPENKTIHANETTDGEHEYSKYREYQIVRKKNMIRRLIRWELTLINFVQTPPQSTVLDEIAFSRAFLEVDLFRSFDRQTGQITSALKDLEKPNPQGTDCFPKVTATGGDRISFLTTIYTHALVMNNILTIAGRNSAIVISRDNRGLTGLASPDFENDGQLRLGQTSLLKQLDQFGASVARFAGNLRCFSDEQVRVSENLASEFFESAGSYFEMKGKNFGVITPPRASAYLDDQSGPIQTAADRIQALCYAQFLYQTAFETLNLPADPHHYFFRFAVGAYDPVNLSQNLVEKTKGIRALLDDSYPQGQVDQFCHPTYPDGPREATKESND